MGRIAKVMKFEKIMFKLAEKWLCSLFGLQPIDLCRKSGPTIMYYQVLSLLCIGTNNSNSFHSCVLINK